MHNRSHDSRGSAVLFGAVGWLFADLLLALAMIFLTANSVAHVTPQPTPSGATPTPTSTPTPTPTPTPVPYGLEQHYVTLTFNVDWGSLVSNDPQTVAALQQQVEATPELSGRHAGLVLIFGGGLGDNGSAAYQADSAVQQYVLQPLGASQGNLFYAAVYRQFVDFSNPANVTYINIYLFKQ